MLNSSNNMQRRTERVEWLQAGIGDGLMVDLPPRSFLANTYHEIEVHASHRIALDQSIRSERSMGFAQELG